MEALKVKIKKIISGVLSVLILLLYTNFVICYADTPNGIKAAYKMVIDQAYSDYVNSTDSTMPWTYSLYDVDKDGIPELIIDDEKPHNFRTVKVYKYNGNVSYMGYFMPGYGEMCGYPDGSGIGLLYAVRNREFIELYTYNGDFASAGNLTDIFEVYSDDDYKNPEDLYPGAYALPKCNVNDYNLLNSILPDNDVDDIKVVLNGAEISFDQPPVMMNDRVLVPIRAIFETLGYTVNWNDYTNTATAQRGDDVITVQLNNSNITYSVNGSRGTYYCDVPPQLISNRTLVPVRAIGESAGCLVNWDDNNKLVNISRLSYNPNETEYSSTILSEDEAKTVLANWLGNLGTWVDEESNWLVSDGLYTVDSSDYYQFSLKGRADNRSTTLTSYVISTDGQTMFEGRCSDGKLDIYQ